jgi:hypothetical protein
MPPHTQTSSAVRARPASALELEAAAGTAYRSIALTMILSFIVSFAYLYWKEKSSEVSVPPPPTIPAPPRAAAPQPVPASDPPLRRARAVEPANPQAAAGPPDIADADQAGAAQLLDLVPVTLFVRTLHAQGRIEGRIRSLSENPLTLTIEAKNRQGDVTAQIALLLAPLQSKTFGTDEGMDLQPGGQLVVRSQGYRDREAAVP